MSVASEITRLNGAKADIIQAIIDKGVYVPSSAKLDEMATYISSITGGGGGAMTMKPIVPVSGNKIIICDSNGYIGFNSLPVYVPSAYTSYAIVVEGADYSSLDLGRVTILDPGTSDIGGRTYRTVTINGVTWLAENLDYKASEIDIGPSGSPGTPAAWYYGNNESTYGENGNKYGLLYNWHAVKHLNDNRELLMNGWHVPTTAEWDALANAVGGAGVAGSKLKSSTGWSSGNGTDDLGFAAFPAGYRRSGSFYDLGSNARFWTATEYSSPYAYYRSFGTGASMGSDYSNETNFAFSVRLVKDS